MMSRFLFQMDMAGNAEAGLGKIEDRLARIDAGTKAVSGSFMQSVRSFQYADRESAATGMFTRAQNYLTNTKNALESFSTEIVKEAAAFQDIESGLRFAFGEEKWGAVFEDVKKDAANLTFTLQDVSELASSLGRMKINPFGGAKKEDQEFLSKTGEKVRALEILQDTADAAGKGTQDLTIAIKNAMSGQWVSLQTRFDLPLTMIQKMKKETAGMKDPQEKYNALVKELGVMFGGAGKLKNDNWNKIAAQVPDLIQQLKGAVGGDGLKVMASALKEFVAAFAALVNNKDAVKGMTDAFTMLAEAFAVIIRTGAAAVRIFTVFAEKAPWIWKAVGAVIAFKAAVAAAVVGSVTLAGALASVVAALSFTTWPVVISALAGIVAFLPLVVALGVAFVGVGAAAAFGAEILTRQWEGPLSMLDKVKLGLSALGELFDSFDGRAGRMSVKTAKALKSAGIFDTVQGIYTVFARAKQAWGIFKDALGDGAKELAPTFLPMLDEIGKLAVELGRAFGIMPKDINKGVTSMEVMKGAAVGAAKGIIWLAQATVTFVRAGVAIYGLVKNWEYLEGAITAVKVALVVTAAILAVMAFTGGLFFAPVIGGFLLIGAAIALVVVGLQTMMDKYEEFKVMQFGTDAEKAAFLAKKGVKDLKDAKEEDDTKGMSFLEKFKHKAGIDTSYDVKGMDRNPLEQKAGLAGTKYRDNAGNYVPTSVGNNEDGFRPPTAEEAEKQAGSDAARPQGSTTFDNYLDYQKSVAVADRNTADRAGAASTPFGPPSAGDARVGTPAVDPSTAAMVAEQQKATAALQIMAAKSPEWVVNLDSKELARGLAERNVGVGGAPLWPGRATSSARRF